MKQITRIKGPPGTGKTTTLINMVEAKLLADKELKPAEILFTTFTRAGVHAAMQRIVSTFGDLAEDFTNFRTLHALCFRHATLQDTGAKIMTYNDWKNFGAPHGWYFTPDTATRYGASAGLKRKGDVMIHLCNLARALDRPVAEVWAESLDFHFVDIAEIERFREALARYKHENGFKDFTDLLIDYLNVGEPLDIKYAFLDEAQDLTVIQWQVFMKMASRAREIYVAGDDDQAIHEWNGAEPREFINLVTDRNIVLSQSHRVPETIHALANTIRERITTRLPGDYHPRKAAGAIHARAVWTPEIYHTFPGSWLLLVRNRSMLETYERDLIAAGVPYTSQFPEMVTVRPDCLRAAVTWEKLANGATVPALDVKTLLTFVGCSTRVKYGAKQLIEALDDWKLLNLDDMKSWFTQRLPWEKMLDKLTGDEVAFIDRAMSRKTLPGRSAAGNLEPKIHLSTIHGAKGLEADNVFLMDSMSYKTMQGFETRPDPEHRVWYVAATRARENLVIETTNKHTYPLFG